MAIQSIVYKTTATLNWVSGYCPQVLSVATGKRNEYQRKLKEKEADTGNRVGVLGDGEERAAKRVRRDGVATAAVAATRRSIGSGGAAKETQRGKEDELDQEADDE